MEDTVWQEIAKWIAGILVGLWSLFIVVLRSWAADRFDAVTDRLDKHEASIESQEEKIAEQHETLQVVLLHIDNGKEDRQRIEKSVKELREENREGFKSISERLDKIAQSK